MNDTGESPLIESLTEREEDVLELLVEGKTNREIAEELVLSLNTVKWYNRQIYGKLQVANREEAAQRAHDLALVASAPVSGRPQYHLPRPATPLLGRERELEELQSLLLESPAHIVSIVGPGGMGKTRLALELARRLNGRFADGACFVPLAPLQSAESIVPAMAQSLRFTFQAGSQDEKTQLLNFLRGKEVLLVLDNFEHLMGSAPLLAEMTRAAPKLKIVVTSRAKLNLRIEQLYALQSLSLGHWQTVEQAKQDPAVGLFLDYGLRLRPNFELRADDLAALRQILQLVDGMPLAIILAAGWLEVLAPADIAAEIEKSIGFLKGGYRDLPRRQRSMRAVFEASWKQLDEEQQKVFSALSVFRGGFTLDAARKVVDATPDTLLGLVSHSLLNRDEDGRFELHELLRQFAAETLSRSPTYEAAVRDDHSGYYLTLLETSESGLKGANAEDTIELIRSDIDNIYEAWDRAVREERYLELGAAAFSLTYFSNWSGRYEQTLAVFARARTRIKDFLSQAKDPDIAIIAVQIEILAYLCELHSMSGDLNQATALGDEALSLFNELETNSGELRYEKALALSKLGWVYTWLDRNDEGRKLVQEGLTLFEEIEDKWQVACSRAILASVCSRSANFEESVRHLRKALQLFEALGNRRWKANIQMLLGFGLPLIGKGEEGKQLLDKSITIFQEIGEHNSTAMVWSFQAERAINQGDFAEGQALAARSMTESRRLGRDNLIVVNGDKWSWATLHLGDYDGALREIHAILEYARDNDLKMRLGRAQALSGDVWLAKQQMDTAIEHLKDGASTLREMEASDYLCFTLGSLCCAHVKSGELSEAEQVIPEALDFALGQKTTLYLAAILPALALLRAGQGMAESAVELYALARHEPYVANSQWYEDVFGHPITEATANLPPETVAAARERGRALDLWETGAALLQELAGPSE